MMGLALPHPCTGLDDSHTVACGPWGHKRQRGTEGVDPAHGAVEHQEHHEAAATLREHVDTPIEQNPDTGSGPNIAAGEAGDRARAGSKCRDARGVAGSGAGGTVIDNASGDC